MLNTVLIAVLSAASVPKGASPLPPDQQAEQLLQEALKLRVEHRPEEALQRLARAEELAPNPKLAANRGLVEAALDRWIPAEQHLASALSSQDPWVAARRDTLSTVLTRVLDHIAHVTVTGLPGTEVTVGEQHVTLPMKTPISALEGSVTVQGTLKGFLPATKILTVQAGAPVTVALAQVPDGAAVAAATSSAPLLPLTPPPAAQDESPRAWALWASGGAAVVGLAAAGTGAWMIHRDGEPSCGSLPAGARCGEVYDTSTRGWIAVGVGGAALAGAGALLWLGLHDPEGRSSVALLPGGIGGTF